MNIINKRKFIVCQFRMELNRNFFILISLEMIIARLHQKSLALLLLFLLNLINFFYVKFLIFNLKLDLIKIEF